MSIIKSLFSKKNNPNDLKLRFSKRENNWRVTKGHAIMYLGDEEQCKNYMNNIKESNTILAEV